MPTRHLRGLFAPPAYDEPIDVDTWRQAHLVRMIVLVFVIAMDVVGWYTFRSERAADPVVIDYFLAVAVPWNVFDLALTTVMIRKKPTRGWLRVLYVVVLIEALGTVAWIQLTGTLTSYFATFALATLAFYRMFFGYWAGLLQAVAFTTLHLGAVALEILGAIPPMSLFPGEASILYELQGTRFTAIVVIGLMYLVTFAAMNALMNVMRVKDRIIAEARRRAERMAADVAQGRLTGTVLDGSLALGELLGRGGMGEIYSATRVEDDANVAVKVLHGFFGADETILERFRREAELAGKLPPEHTAQIYDVGVDRQHDLHYIVMERLFGEDLGAHLIRRGKLPPDEVVALGRAIAAALDAAHTADIIHRDLKPQNVFMCATAGADFDLRLLDFGIAKFRQVSSGMTLTAAAAVLGTPGFMPPEQALGKQTAIGPASDRFALAAILYRALTGKLPFTASELGDYIEQVVSGDVQPVSELVEVHKDVDAVFAVGLAKHPTDRYPTAMAMVHDLESALVGKLEDTVHERADVVRQGGVGEVATLEPK